MDAVCMMAGIHPLAPQQPIIAVTNGGEFRLTAVAADKSATSTGNLRWGFSFRHSLGSLWPGARNRHEQAIAVDDAVLVEEKEDIQDREQPQNEVWVFENSGERFAEGREGRSDYDLVEETGEKSDSHCHDGCDACGVDEDEEKIQFERGSFSKLLRKVPLEEARLYARMSYLGTLTYRIPEIKPGNLLKNYGLCFLTSSLEKKEQTMKLDQERLSSEDLANEEKRDAESGGQETGHRDETDKEGGEAQPSKNSSGVSAAYQIATSTASYLHSHARSFLSFKSSKSMSNENVTEEMHGGTMNVDLLNQDVASFMATTDSVTAVVTAKEEVKQAVADDLKSTHSSPCEWFACDDDQSATRFFVIQGSESMASWQANLLFEPILFEGLDVLVHRGIYEAAKGIYEQMLPEIRTHLKTHGNRASFRFTGHSLGGSLSLLINLMLLVRGEVPRSSLLPVVTFGAPFVMCGGDRLLRSLELPQNHLRSIVMHRDIVPRAFSCNYPNHVAQFLKAVNGNFRNHPCLNNQKLLYSPMGEFIILQPEDKFSPNHDLLPSGSGLYVLSSPASDVAQVEKQVLAAQAVFLNSPHPLDILSDRSAYGSEGTIQRDHDMSSYLKSVRQVIRRELSLIRKAKREHRWKVWWPIYAPDGVKAGIIVSEPVSTVNLMGQVQIRLSGIVQTGTESLKRFSTLVASKHMHLLVVLLLPVRSSTGDV